MENRGQRLLCDNRLLEDTVQLGSSVDLQLVVVPLTEPSLEQFDAGGRGAGGYAPATTLDLNLSAGLMIAIARAHADMVDLLLEAAAVANLIPITFLLADPPFHVALL